MHAVLFVMVIAMWLPAVCDMSDTFVSIGLSERSIGRHFQTYRFVEARRGLRCINEQRERAMRSIVHRPHESFSLIQSFLQHIYRIKRTCGKHKYHILFTPECGKRTIFDLYIEGIREILRQVCAAEDVKILEEHLQSDSVHLLVKVPPGMDAPRFAAYLKRQSSLLLFDNYETLKYQFEKQQIWSGGYYVSDKRMDDKRVAKYVIDQEIRDMTDNKTNVKAQGEYVKAGR